MIAGRVGWAWDRVLFYAKGGVGFANVSSSFSDTCVTAPCGGATLVTNASSTQAFGVGGGGIEWAFASNWSVKGEYLFMGFSPYSTNLGTVTTTATGTGILVSDARFLLVPTTTFTNTASVRTRFYDHLLRVGVNYRF